ncbi:dihydrolipoamide acetyltransferase family protein [Nocardioides sp.]|uniref:dihydrolipoamide acetyltransferase family protein n=1 Tax=Nocardioides sp. TaxID=35761 RepID=UPI002612BCD6|nr:dihydrolipoamide acetyltransferase family protein [Nocardioides sp.]MDI6912380.1 dihydrolipoamide acetyltransferase family protein [Nocardioides sp.]
MTDIQEFALPDVGEGLTEAEVVGWHVAVGDAVAINDLLVDIETAKSVVELPSPYAGTVTALLVAEGATVPVGTPLISIGPAGAAPAEAAPPAEATVLVDEKPAVLVGPGPKDASPRRRRLGGVSLAGERLGDARAAAWPAAPRIRTFDPDPDAASAPVVGRETRTPVKGVRKVTAQAMSRSAFTAPHVTEWLSVDVTRTMEMVRKLRAAREWDGVRITPLLFVARAFLLAIRGFPGINASWDENPQEIVVKHYVNLGIATATPRGLIVPNIKDADTMSLRELAEALDRLVVTARAGRTQPAETSGGTATITNIGALGIDAGTPILNPGEAAILAFGAVRATPWAVDGAVAIRDVTQLAMSFDHRLVDGELGSHVLARTGQLLHDPGAAFLHV